MKRDLDAHGLTRGCPQCDHWDRYGKPLPGKIHSTACRERIMKALEQEGSVHAARAWGTLEAAAKLCTRLGDGAEAGRWNARAAKCALLALGRQSTEFERLAAAIRAK